MKRFRIKGFITLLLILLCGSNMYAQNDSDNTYQTANNISINTTYSGNLGIKAGDYTDFDDWYKITLPGDGKVEIIQTMSSELYSGMYLYTESGGNQFASKMGKKGGTDTLVYNNLGGTFYVRINNWSYSSGDYSIRVNFTPTDYTNDSENNDSYENAISGGTFYTGHLGFYSASTEKTDYDDWYKVTLPGDGRLEVVVNSSSALYSAVYLYQENGKNYYTSMVGQKGEVDTLVYKNISGTVYVRLSNWSYTYGSYQMKINYYPALYNEDSEPNNSTELAVKIANNTEYTGHIGYYSSSTGNTDYDDWYTIELPTDGRIDIVQTTTSDLYSGINLYESDGYNLILVKVGIKDGSDTLTYKYLKSGIYKVRINNWSYSFGSYKLKVNFTPTPYDNDVEPNDDYNQAVPIQNNTVYTGHIGYRAKGSIDYDDWYTFTLTENSKISITETMTDELYSGINLYNNVVNNVLGYKCGKLGGADTLSCGYELEPGQYKLRISNWSYTYGSYQIKVLVSKPNNLSSNKALPASISVNDKILTVRLQDLKTIQIYDVYGRLHTLKSTTGQTNESCFDVSTLPEGMYIVRLYDGAKTISEKILIK
jgi:roadblock/LC7 domain-containing protein